jgi:hypothetical protein
MFSGAGPFNGAQTGLSADALASGLQQWAMSWGAGTGGGIAPTLPSQFWFGAPVQTGPGPWPTSSPGADPFAAQRGFGGAQAIGQGQWPQTSLPALESVRQAQICQALAAKQLVLEAICRACGISL